MTLPTQPQPTATPKPTATPTPKPTATPTPKPTATPTPKPTATPTPRPTATPTPKPTVAPKPLPTSKPVTTGTAALTLYSYIGYDMLVGGPGRDAGKLLELRDITFDAQGNLYTLDGSRLDAASGQRVGNLRVQKFDTSGKLLQTFDLRDATTHLNLGESNEPFRMAVDGDGYVYVTVPYPASKVLVYAPNGSFVRALDVPNAKAITVANVGGVQRIVVAPEASQLIRGSWQRVDGDKLLVLSPRGTGIEGTIDLPQQYALVMDLTSDAAGNFYLKADTTSIYKFSPTGELLQTWGGAGEGRASDGSQALYSVAVDDKGNVYSMTWGNPGNMVRYDADGTTVTTRAGQFSSNDPWSNSSYVPLAIDPTTGRLWAGATQVYTPSVGTSSTRLAVPLVVRTAADYFDADFGEGTNVLSHTPIYKVGFAATLGSDLPDNLSYQAGAPVQMNFTVKPAQRTIDRATLNWHVYDESKNEIASGSLVVALKNGEASDANFNWTPPRYGSYFVTAHVSAAQGELTSLSQNIVVTPQYDNLKTLEEGERTGTATTDAATQAWAGLPNVRLYPHLDQASTPDAKQRKLDELDAQLSAAERNGVLAIVQLADKQTNYDPNDLRLLMQRFGSRIKYLEVVNEPNFSGSVDNYFRIHSEAYAIAKGINRNVQIIGPATVNIDLDWARRLYELGFKNVSDGYSFHDYEGHESIDPAHWQWKLGELRKIMAQYGDANKPLWQTERAIAGVRGGDYQGLVQAIRLSMHLDLMETLGIPAERDLHFYMNQSGYSAVPSYLWSGTGPMPGVLATRTRYALTGAKGRKYADQLNFGSQANDLFLGVRFVGVDGTQTISLRNLGTVPTPLQYAVSGAGSIFVTDWAGNSTEVPVVGGKVTLPMTQLPIYVELPRNATLTAPQLNFGTNVASQAHFTYSAPLTNNPQGFGTNIARLNNGVVEAYQKSDPLGDTNGARIFTGAMPRDAQGKLIPQTLTMSFDQPQTLQSLVLRGMHADNSFCALLSYDLQYQDAQGNWQTLAQVRNALPASEQVKSADASGAIWTDDTNYYINRFAPVTTSAMRVVVRDVTRGFLSDDGAQAWGKSMEPYFMMREVQLFAP